MLAMEAASISHPGFFRYLHYTYRKRGFNWYTVTFVGDLKYGRTVHSLGYFMALYGNKMIFVSPKALRIPEEITTDLRSQEAEIEENEDLKKTLSVSDIIYVTRIQGERFKNPAEYEKLKGLYIINKALINHAKKESPSFILCRELMKYLLRLMIIKVLPTLDKLIMDFMSEWHFWY